MARIFFICGFIGSGKTSYSKKLAEEEHAFRFSLDEWMIPLFGEHMAREDFDARIDTLTRLFQDSAEQLLALGVSVIFDFGFWRESERAEFRKWADTLNVECELIYFDCPYEVCRMRALARNSDNDGKSFEITDDMLAQFWSWFEVPAASECSVIIDSK